MGRSHSKPVAIGVDVGSTTVKAVVLDPETLEILWSDYQRHNTKQPEKVAELLTEIEASFPESPRSEWRVFMTGSGAAPLCPSLGAKFVQEVNAVTLVALPLAAVSPLTRPAVSYVVVVTTPLASVYFVVFPVRSTLVVMVPAASLMLVTRGSPPTA